MNLKDFADQHGISAIVRRHFGYRTPVSDAELGGYPTRGALTYMRALERGRLGLTHAEAVKAFEQGGRFIALHRENNPQGYSSGVVPALIITGDDQRNLDGGHATAEGIAAAGGPTVEVYTSPAVTYPHYASFGIVRAALQEHGDYATHRYLAEQPLTVSGLETDLLWSEPPEVFEARILAAVTAEYGVQSVLFDLNFEQVTLLYFLLVRGFKREQIPFEKGAWTPTMGGGVVLSGNRKVVREFKPDLTVVE